MTFAIWEDSEKKARAPQSVEVDRNTVSMLPNGGYVVGWREGNKLKFQIFDGHGQPTGEVKTLPGTASQNNFSISVLRDDGIWGDDGRIVISWNESVDVNGTASYTLKSQVFDLSGNIPAGTTTAEMATGLTLHNLDTLSVARNFDGSYVTAYDAGNEIHLTVHTREGKQIDGRVIAAGSVQLPDVISLGSDKYVVSYSISSNVYFKMVDAKADPSTWTQVLAGAGAYSDLVVNKDANGNTTGFTLVSDNGNKVTAKIFDNAGKQVGADVVLTGIKQYIEKPFSAVALKGGRVAVVYAEDPPGAENGDVYIRIINPNVEDDPFTNFDERLGPPLLVHNATGLQRTPAVSEMEDGRLAITWTNTSDGNGNVSTVIVDPRVAPVTTRGTIGADVYVGSEHAGDVLAGYLGNDTFVGSLGADAMHGGEGIDNISYQYAKTGVTIVLAEGGIGGLAGAEAVGDSYTSMENAIGSKFDDGIMGNGDRNRLQGGNGNDTLDAGGQIGDEDVDTLEGGSGNDEYYVDSTTDQVIEGTGTDSGTDLVYSNVSYTLSSNVENLILWGNADVDGTGNTLANRITGNDGANILKGGSGNDSLNGGIGSDRLEGGTGNDTFYIEESSDSIVETSSGGTDRLYAGVSYTLGSSAYVESMYTDSSSGTTAINLKGNNIAQKITGNAGTNTLTGLGGNDVINGGSGSDRVYGGKGNDVLYGGGSDSKRDTFVFDTALSSRSNVDSVKDFSTRYDRIELDNDVFTRAGSVGGLKSDAFVSYSRARDREDRIIYDKATGALYYDADGTGSAAQIKFAQLAKNLAMNYADFIVIG